MVKRVHNYVAQQVAARSMSFTAGEMTLDCVCATLTTITDDKPIKRKAMDVLTLAGFVDEAVSLFRLKYLTAQVDTSSSPNVKPFPTATPSRRFNKRRRIQRKRASVKRKILELGRDVQKLKHEFLSGCPYITIVIDEGNNWSKECPLYVAVIACTMQFEWRIMFIGQADCCGKKDGKSIHQLVKQVFVDAGMSDIYEKIMSASTDGASVMRSTKDFAGLDCRGTEGTSFAAFLKIDLKDNIDFWHCLIHQLNLSVNDALDAIPACKLFWVPHVSLLCNVQHTIYFSC